jgi:hypothetical protein
VKPPLIVVSGMVVEGHRVASGPSPAYPYGSLEKQIPCFKNLGLDLSSFYVGTLNVSIAPHKFEIVHPEYTFEKVEWTDLHPPETFSFSRCTLGFNGVLYAGWIYYPHPETKKAHFQNPSLLEIITHKIPGIKYGDTAEVHVKGDEINVR